MKGTNVWNGSGNIASEVDYGRTGRRQEEACNFRLAIEQRNKPLLFVRINVYGGNVEVCRLRSLKQGDYVVVSGELMNRNGQNGILTDIRCGEIIILGGNR